MKSDKNLSFKKVIWKVALTLLGSAPLQKTKSKNPLLRNLAPEILNT